LNLSRSLNAPAQAGTISPPPFAPEQMTPAPKTPTRRPFEIGWGKRILGGITLVGAFTLLVAVMAGVAPLFFGYHPFVVLSGSMEPTIATGAIALARVVPSQNLRVGDVIAFNPHADAALPVIHRIIALEDRRGVRYAITRGDANTGADAEIALPSPGLQVMGSIPFAGYAVYYAAQPAGTLVLVWIPLALLVGFWITDRVRQWRARRNVTVM